MPGPFNTKVTRRVAESMAVAFEYYNQKGTWRRLGPSSEQGKTLYAVIEVDNKIVSFHYGVGHGPNGATDRCTVKMIFDLAL